MVVCSVLGTFPLCRTQDADKESDDNFKVRHSRTRGADSVCSNCVTVPLSPSKERSKTVRLTFLFSTAYWLRMRKDTSSSIPYCLYQIFAFPCASCLYSLNEHNPFCLPPRCDSTCPLAHNRTLILTPLLLPPTCTLYAFACPASRLATSTRCLRCWQITRSRHPRGLGRLLYRDVSSVADRRRGPSCPHPKFITCILPRSHSILLEPSLPCV